MTILAIVGKADKRVIAYPLMKTCGLMGKTCVVTDDVTYRRLYSGTENTGYINDVEVNIEKDLGKDIAERIELKKYEDGFDYLIYLADTFIPPNATKVIALCSQSRTFCGEEIEGILEDDEDGRIALATITLYAKAKNYWKVPITQIVWKPEYVQYVCETEERRILLPLKDKLINGFLCGTYAKTLNLTTGNMKKIMDRKIV